MKSKKLGVFTTIFLLSLTVLKAQESPISAGGEALGAGGKVSYSIGQVLFNIQLGTNINLTEGLQQPYEISKVIGFKEEIIDLSISVYPNPSSNYLTLSSITTDNYNYQLIDAHGKIVEKASVDNKITVINMSSLAKAVYFLQITKQNELVKTFKILKH